MSRPPAVERILEKVLEHRGLVPLELLLAELVPVERLRALAREHALSPKGFRIEAASARSLAQVLLRDLVPDVLAGAVRELAARLQSQAPPAPPKTEARPVEADRTAELAAEVERLRALQSAAVSAQQRSEARVAELESRSAHQAQQIASLRGDLAAARANKPGPIAPVVGTDRETERRLHEAEAELEASGRSELEYRRRIAEQQTAIRALEQRVEELEELVPKNRRRQAPPPPPPPVERFRVPHFTPDFYRSLVSRDVRHVEAAFDAVWRFALSGYGYPGLEVKQLEGVDLWSMRAGLKLRVYFRPRADGDIDIVAMGDREDQDTLLRRLR